MYWVLTDGCMCLLVHFLHRFGCDSILDEAGELFLVGLLILLHQVAHVLRHVQTENVLPV